MAANWHLWITVGEYVGMVGGISWLRHLEEWKYRFKVRMFPTVWLDC